MYRHHSQQQGSQPFSNGPRPPHQQPPINQNRPTSSMMSQVIDFQFPRPTQLPDELESALAIHGTRDMDHRTVDHMDLTSKRQNLSSGSGVSQQHGSYSSNPVGVTSDSQPDHHQEVNWSSYPPPTKLFTTQTPNAGHQFQHQGHQKQPQSSHTGTRIPNWTGFISDSLNPQAPHVGGGDGQSLYTAESAGSILASFGLSNEDLEVLSHYPDDQLTPDTLPFILRDIQLNKTGNQKSVAATTTSVVSRSICDLSLPSSCTSSLTRSHSPEVPSLLTVTQTAGKVIDYGHASRAKDERNTRETFKREQLSNERTVKLYPSSSASSTSPKTDKPERRQVHLEHSESSKHGDRDYRKSTSEQHKNSRSPGREFPPSSKSRNLERDYRHDGRKSVPSPETRSEALSRPSHSSSASKPHSSNKKLPTPTMISDFSAVAPKLYPHTCSLCHVQCDQEKDWFDHINTVNHTAACRDLRNKYPEWKPNLPRSGRYGSHSPPRSGSRSLSYSPPPRPHGSHRVGRHSYRPHERPYPPHHYPRYQHYTGISSRSAVKRSHDSSTKFPSDPKQHPPSKAGHTPEHEPLHSSTKTSKSVMKHGSKTIKISTAKPTDMLPPAKKKKKQGTVISQDSSFADRLVYLTGIPKIASEEDVTDLVGSFGKVNNVILLPCSEEENEKGEGQKASVCMVKAEDAHSLANSTNLSIRQQQLTALVATKPEEGLSFDDFNSKLGPEQDSAGGETELQKFENGLVLITGLPEGSCSESDIVKLLQPFGTVSDMILASHIGKVLVSVLDMDVAQEMVKVNAFMPMKIADCELKMIHVKQCISRSTPVALYNLLMGSTDQSESSVPVSWSSLLVIRNVPNTVSGSSEVQKLVRRFGTVIRTLVLNSMVICEMATAAMAQSVYKRFQAFPCIIQNNPLFFSRKPDPKTGTHNKVISACLETSDDTPVNVNSSKISATADKEMASLEGVEKDRDMKDEEIMVAAKDETLDENMSTEDVDKNNVQIDVIFDTSEDAKPQADLETDTKQASADDVIEREERKEGEKTPAGEEKTQISSDEKATSMETVGPELPELVNQKMENVVVECGKGTTSQSSNATPSTNKEQDGTPKESENTDVRAEKKELKKPEREWKDMETRKEKEARELRKRGVCEKEKVRRDRERMVRARKDQEKRQEERRECERRERARRERKRVYERGVRSSYRLQQSSRDERHSSPDTDTRKVEEEIDQFPFNMSDFVTVDEVGEETDLPSQSTTVPMETTAEDTPKCVQKDEDDDTPMEPTIEIVPGAIAIVKSDNHISDCGQTAETSDGVVSALPPVKQCDSSQTHETQCQPGAAETAPQDPSAEDKATVTAAPEGGECSNSFAPGAEASLSKEDLNLDSVKEEESDTADKQGKAQSMEKKEMGVPAVELGKDNTSADHIKTEEKTVKEIKTITMTDNCSLPPFNPTNPVGMEFLVPKTGFFCKVCNRFFSGNRDSEIIHCKTLKHYNNLQNYLQTKKNENTTITPACN